MALKTDTHLWSGEADDRPGYARRLNDPQWRAVSILGGPLLILAGAGTGKTRALTTRLAHIIHTGVAYPSQVLAVTFTNKAANELRMRIQTLLSDADSAYSVDGMWIGTFHALAVRILRRHSESIGLSARFTILDNEDQIRLLKQVIPSHHLDAKKVTPKSVMHWINRVKDQGLTPTEAERHYGQHAFVPLYQEYEKRLMALQAVDFGGLILHNLSLFKDFPNILKVYQDKFAHILVDEYQDTNTAQYLWLRYLAHRNICCVGDDDQSIYGWRGAELHHILNFEKDFPDAHVVRLEQNYRSKGYVLEAAGGLIAHNQGRLGKTLWTDAGDGEKVLIRGTWNSDEEARFISDKVNQLLCHGYKLDQIAILVRASFQTREMEDHFLKAGIPYRVVGGLRFYERQEVRDALAYVRLLAQPDDGLAFERIINTPRRGVGEAAMQALHQLARERDVSLPQAAYVYARAQKSRSALSIGRFLAQMAQWRQHLDQLPHAQVVNTMLEGVGYLDIWRRENSTDAAGRLENLKELMGAIGEFETLQGFLEHVSLVVDNSKDEHVPMVTMMTLHTAKGLEFAVVCLPGWEEGLFPHNRALCEKGGQGLEEERRLAYVGMSRAKERAIITYSLQRRTYQGWNNTVPSRFIQEIPAHTCVYILPNGKEGRMQPCSFND